VPHASAEYQEVRVKRRAYESGVADRPYRTAGVAC
jgi:hypothetical protein